jgi:hypothetical protein
VPQTFELRATPPEALKAGGGPDELMIDWAGLPKGSTAQIYLPDVDASAILAMASRRVFGAFQIAIPVHTKAILLPGEERQLSILRWIQDGIDPRSRWHAVFTRYLGQLAGRVDGLGGTSGDVHPSPTGDWHRHRLGKPDRHATGKVCAVVYDRYGDFDGFLLDTPHGERRYLSREKDLAALIERAWSPRLRITIVSDSGEPGKPREVILREPPASSTCDLC